MTIRTIDIPLNLKYNLAKMGESIDYVYVLRGLTYQIDIDKTVSYDYSGGFGNPYDFSYKRNFLFPNIGFGLEKNWSESNLIRIQLNYRLLRCDCEYLNPKIDKLAVEVSFIKTLDKD